LPIKKKQKRQKRVRLGITKEANIKQKQIRKDQLKNQIIGEYQMQMGAKNVKNQREESMMID
jgi:hypothetical protein